MKRPSSTQLRAKAGNAPKTRGNRPADAIVHELVELERTFRNVKILLGQQLYRSLLERPRVAEKLRLTRHGFKVYSKHDEDGLIREIFSRIGTTGKSFLEIGAEAHESNTLLLLVEGWSGVWMDGDPAGIKAIERQLRPLLSARRLRVQRSFLTRENINREIERAGIRGEIDFLSIDVDGNDYHLLAAIDVIRPRVVCIEFNAKFPPPIRWIMKYDARHTGNMTDHFSASLQSMTEMAARKGYALVGCSITGVNAFYVRSDLARGKFAEPFTAENHYEKPNYDLYFGLGTRLIPTFGEFETGD